MLNVHDYFDGKVKSIAFETASLPATVGVMEAGEYEFSTTQKETIIIVSGALTVLLPGEDEWHTYATGERFVVEPDQRFQLKVEHDTAYFCTYE